MVPQLQFQSVLLRQSPNNSDLRGQAFLVRTFLISDIFLACVVKIGDVIVRVQDRLKLVVYREHLSTVVVARCMELLAVCGERNRAMSWPLTHGSATGTPTSNTAGARLAR